MVVANGRAVKGTLPSCSAHPAMQAFVPACAVSVNAVAELEGRGIELEDREIAELVSVGVEQLVVIDRRMLAKNPLAIWVQIGLRWAALDFVQERVLPFIRVRQIELIGK